MRTGDGEFKLDERTKKNLGSVAPSFGLDRFGNPGATSRSGHERNRLFMSRFPAEEQFTDISGVSGADSPADGRSVAFLDFDRDGWQDLALANANAPKLQLFRNQLGSSKLVDPALSHMIALRLVGGNDTASSSQEWSSRDAYGAQITLTAGGQPLLRSLRAGEGLAAQHSKTMIVGIGANQLASSLEVRWPSGKRQSFSEIPAGSLVTIYENKDQSPSGAAMLQESYRRADPLQLSNSHGRQGLNTLQLASQAKPRPSSLRMYVTTATWCAACIAELPELKQLRASFEPQLLQIFGVPADEKDTTEMWDEFLERHQPAYEHLTHLSREDVARVEARVLDDMGKEGMPASVVTDENGRVLLTRFGAPSISQLRKLLDR